MIRRTLAVLAVLSLTPLASEAQSYRCVGKDGKRYYGSAVPPACHGQPIEELNSQGTVVKRIDPHGAAKERLAKQNEETKKREQEAAARETARRNNALLATYTSEKDIEDARARALVGNTKAIREAETRIEALRKGGAAQDAKASEDEIKALENLVDVKKREADAINTRYDEDRKRYVELTRTR